MVATGQGCLYGAVSMERECSVCGRCSSCLTGDSDDQACAFCSVCSDVQYVQTSSAGIHPSRTAAESSWTWSWKQKECMRDGKPGACAHSWLEIENMVQHWW